MARALIRSLACIFAIVATVATLAVASAAPARAAIEPGPGKGWLTIASRSRAKDAIEMARGYTARFPSALVFSSTNGYFAVSLGWADTAAGQPLLHRLIDSGAIPGDSYYTAGQRFVGVVWSAANAQNYGLQDFLAVTRLDLGGPATPPVAKPAPDGVPIDPRTGIVANLSASGDSFLSLRTGPGTANPEIARMRAGTTLNVTARSGPWYKVSLSNGMVGWAHGRFIEFRQVPVIGPDRQFAEPAPPTPPTVGPDPATQPPPPDDRLATTEPPPDDRQSAGETGTGNPDIALSGQKRVALVMGNSAYQNTTVLPNPKNDASDMAAKLQSLGFQVITGLDRDKAGMEAAIRDFVRILPESDVALFFYAGHAMQVNGRNHLIPVDARLEDSTAIDFETIDLGVILEFMNTDNRISIALLDACRDNPLSRRFARNFSASRSAFIGRGLAAPSTGAGEMLIGFATAPGEVALDGDGDNSPFTTALLRHIDARGLDIELMLKRVRQDVYDLTDRTQEPWVNSALRREFQFNPE